MSSAGIDETGNGSEGGDTRTIPLEPRDLLAFLLPFSINIRHAPLNQRYTCQIGGEHCLPPDNDLYEELSNTSDTDLNSKIIREHPYLFAFSQANVIVRLNYHSLIRHGAFFSDPQES